MCTKAEHNRRMISDESDSGNVSELDDLLCTAKKVDMPEWATHVAVSKMRDNDAEPCAWLDAADDYIDEDPSTLKNGEWSGCYKKRYWHFFTREDVCA
jgi:hypothetical protein